jgi:sugar phosphate isomerase/epimerase
MDRRSFVFQSSGLVLTAWVSPALAKITLPKDKMDRIAMGTLLYHDKFKETNKNVSAAGTLTLMDIPQHHRDKYGIKKLEFWSEHFASNDKGYLTDLKAKIKAAGCELLDVQVDSSPFDKRPCDLASTNEELRLASIQKVKDWMDIANLLGSKCVRVNPGTPKGTVEQSIKSYQELIPYAKSKNLIIIAANHFGIETNADKHVAIVKGAGSGLYTEPDFGNYNGAPDMYDSLAKIIPYAYIVSAKVATFKNTPNGVKHTSYDFDRCVKLAESLGFKGTYMVAQWGNNTPDIDYEKVAAWTIDHIKANIKA